MAKKVKLTVAERIVALGLLRQFKGDIVQQKDILKDLDNIPLSEDEMKKCGYKEIKEKVKDEKTGEDTEVVTSIVFPDSDKVIIDIELHDGTVEYLTLTIEELSKDKKITLTDQPLVSLLEKIK